MRGEETQLIGCIGPSVTIENELFIFPGTHSKHICVKNNVVVEVKTFMTGDLFELLSQKSILSTSIEKDAEPNSDHDLISFKKGVKDSVDTNLLHAIFKIRTHDLLELLSKKENFHYLSGLLIGTELKDLKTTDVDVINLVCGSNLVRYYHAALLELGLSKNIKTFPAKWVDEAVVRGQLKIANQLKLLP
jgi:2-dehydro-3-deoxygalactonokinase